MNPIAIVILNWNGAAMLRRFLPSVVSSTDGLATVYVADNGSTDESSVLVRSGFPSVVWLPLDANYGFAGGYNRALRLVEEPYYMILNSDVEVSSGWLLPLYTYLQSHAEVAACQPKLLWQPDPSRFEYAGACGGYKDFLGHPFCRGRVMSTVESDVGQYDTVGGFDARFFAHMEEVDLCWRLNSRGYGVVCVPSSVARHIGGGTLPQNSPHKTFLNFRNNLLMLYKNLPADELASVMRWRLFLDGVAALRFLFLGEWANFWSVCKARFEFHRIHRQFDADRNENLRLAVRKDVPGRMCFSLLWRYYVRGQHTFSQLMKK